MNVFNAAVSALFDILLAPFGHRFAAFDLVVWPVLAGVVALLVYKKISNQAGITRAKDGITQHLLEVVLVLVPILYHGGYGVLRSLRPREADHGYPSTLMQTLGSRSGA